MTEAIHALHLTKALTPAGWRRDVRLSWRAGVLDSVETGVAPCPGEPRGALGAPGLSNLHSHAFQRAMAGLTERRGPAQDNFWSWREAMYRFANAMSPEQCQAVAAKAYVEMLEAGFTRVGEFHYLHHAPDGEHYDDVGEMSARVAAAAEATGIGMTLLPVFYAHSGFGGAPPTKAQRRFVCDLEAYARLLERAGQIVAALDGAKLGVAPHSLRATTPEEIERLVELAGARPIHIHVAEQTAEVEGALAALGARPVEFLLQHFPVDARWCLIHATHMTDEETRALARSGAVAGLCPITEANLGDGFFNLSGFQEQAGRYGVGSDSNVEISLAGELRMLEYGQRLNRRARNVAACAGGSTGRALFDAALEGGAQALGSGACGLSVGADADVVVWAPEAIEAIEHDDEALDRWIFARGAGVESVIARGRVVVREGAHAAREAIDDRFRFALRDLLASAPSNPT